MSRVGPRLARLEAASPPPPQSYLMADLAVARWLGHALGTEQAAELAEWEAGGRPSDAPTSLAASSFDVGIARLVERIVAGRGKPMSEAATAFLAR